MKLDDLPWQDVIHSHIFNRLNLMDLLHLRNASRKLQELVDSYLITLKSLDLSSCSDFEPSFFPVLVRVCESLESINFTGSHWLQDSHITNFLHKYPDLTNLNLSSCNNEMMQFNFFATSRCENLVSVTLRGCTITDKTLMDLAKNSKILEILDLRHCPKITDTGILSLRFLSRLQLLWVHGSKVTEYSLAPLRNKVKIDVPQKLICVARPLNLQV